MGVSVADNELDDDNDFAESHEINVTPFIDVILVLLIIFMVAAPLSTVDLPIDLPTSTANPQKKPDKPTYVTIKADLAVAIGEDLVKRVDLVRSLDAMADASKDGASSSAPTRRSLWRAMDVLKILRDGGYTRIKLKGLEGVPSRAAHGAGNRPRNPERSMSALDTNEDKILAAALDFRRRRCAGASSRRRRADDRAFAEPMQRTTPSALMRSRSASKWHRVRHEVDRSAAGSGARQRSGVAAGSRTEGRDQGNRPAEGLPTETEDPDRMVTQNESKKPKEEEPKVAAVETAASTGVGRRRSTAPQVTRTARRRQADAPRSGIGKTGQAAARDLAEGTGPRISSKHKKYPNDKKRPRSRSVWRSTGVGHVLSGDVDRRLRAMPPSTRPRSGDGARSDPVPAAAADRRRWITVQAEGEFTKAK